jgi:hypothetical protein
VEERGNAWSAGSRFFAKPTPTPRFYATGDGLAKLIAVAQQIERRTFRLPRGKLRPLRRFGTSARRISSQEICNMPRTPAAAARFAPALVVAALFAALSTGCSSSHTSWKKGQAPKLGTAPQTGMYELVSGKDVAARYQVFAGEPLGFRKNENGRVEAVAGMYTIDLSSMKSYAWRMSKHGAESAGNQ